MLKAFLAFFGVILILTVIFIILQAIFFRISPFSVLVTSLLLCIATGLLALPVVSYLEPLSLYGKLTTFTAFFSGFLCFSLWVPVFIDRSVTYQIQILCSEQRELSKSDVIQIMETDIYKTQRLTDLVNSGLLKQKGENFTPTAKGDVFAKSLLFFMKIYGLDKTYSEVRENLHNNKRTE